MKILVFLIIVTIATESFSQDRVNRHDRISKIEYEELRKQKGNFIPSGIRADTVIVVKYTAMRLQQLQRIARQLEFARNGEDTTGYTDEILFGKRQVDRGWRILEKLAKSFPDEQSKALAKKGVVTLVVDEDLLQLKNWYKEKVWLITEFVCSQDTYKGPWVSSLRNRFYDPRSEKLYEIFRPLNYNLFDLLE